jgi:TonB family protein
MTRRIVLLALFLLALPRHSYPEADELCLCKFVAPRYTPLARQSRVEGVVRLSVSVDSGGTPASIKIIDEGHPLLRESAVDAVKKWRFCHTTREVMPVTIKFSLQGNPTDSWFPTDVTFEPPATVEIIAPSAATLQR